MTEKFVAGSVDTELAWWLDIQHCESVTTTQDHDGLLVSGDVDQISRCFFGASRAGHP